MTAEKKVARRKLSLLELASDLNNVSKACQVMGYSRQQFYEIRRNFQTYGADGLLDRIPGAKGPHPNRVSEVIEKAILAYSLEAPTHGCLRVAQELAILAVKSDVTEEIDRLRAHVTAARELLQAGGAVGRKLDFLMQEFNREANTLCSKSQDATLTAIGLDLKLAIDQTREQVQNVE